MRVILTHEQADFDALASLLGAYLLDEDTHPVLPHRMNRNVRAFLNLYGAELPFIDRRDLPNEPVELIYLVDSQSIISIKGMNRETRVKVIDHHSLKEDLPPNWTATIEDIGATSTLLVEALQEKNGLLNTIHATLLLLGIYEDTGSLTYSRTTSRDLRAAAFLLEQGANMKIAADFLNHPLSDKQQSLYEKLYATIESHQIHGHTIFIAQGDAKEVEEELSSIAHKLRDLLDPDALFVLLETRGGIQLIARSTSDNIDVSIIAAHFGGGGHSRAAAGLIQGRDLTEVHDELVRILPDYVRPAIRVAQIMSSGPQILSPDTPVEEAAHRMQRYGYEGYPVVKNGKVVGLLTRRAVDRALSHKLNLKAASLMEAGEIFVHPDDSVESLQRLMTETGWGQIPVIQPETGQIIGIVTRTDLFKTFTKEAPRPSRESIAEKLESALPPARHALLKCIAQASYKQRSALYVVGGFARDLLLDRPSLDFDLVVEGDAINLARHLARHYGGKVTSHHRFGTAKWSISTIQQQLSQELSKDVSSHLPISPNDLPSSVDLITARTEFYTHPTALPTVESGSIKLDLHRRDFTINTLAIRLDGRYYGELKDYWGGYHDLRQGQVRVLHSLSFVDDPTRIIRAVRFEKRFSFQIEPRTQQLLNEALPLLSRISGARIRHELDHVFDEDQAIPMVTGLHELGVLSAIHPDLTWDEWSKLRFTFLPDLHPEPDWEVSEHLVQSGLRKVLSYILLLIRLPAKQARQVLHRLSFSRKQAVDILAANQLWHEMPSMADRLPSEISIRLDEVPPLARYAVFLALDDPRLREQLQDYARKWHKVTPSISGHELRAIGLPPGPVYRRILDALRAGWLDGEIKNTEEERRFLEKWLANEGIFTTQ